MKFYFHILLIIGLVSSCAVQKEHLDSKAYLSWYASEANPFIASTNEKNVVFDLHFLPSEVEASSLFINGEMNSKELKKELQASSKDASFKLTIQLPSEGIDIYHYNPSAKVNLSDRMRYFSFDFKNDISLVTKDLDTIPCSNILHERGMSNSPLGSFILDFNGISLNQFSQLIIKDKALVEKTVLIDLSTWNIKQLPKLTF